MDPPPPVTQPDRHTDGHRIYAIGDVHGCRGALADMRARIARDLEVRPHPRPMIVFVGDYVDRGPDSRGVIEDILEMQAGPLPVRTLRGNHDRFLLDYATPGREMPDAERWAFGGSLGGHATLASYGVVPGNRHEAARGLPPAHRAFLERTELLVPVGGYVFVHAGVRPGVPLDAQEEEDLIWIRDPFLFHDGPFPGVVVHGHTPVPQVEDHGNRIAIDTGAVFGGPLSCLVLEDAAAGLLEADGPAPLG